MSQGDAWRIPQLPQMSPQAINQEIARIWTAVNALSGRSEGSQIRDDLEVLGGISAQGLSGTSLSLGDLVLANEDHSLNPNGDIPSVGLSYSHMGTVFDLNAHLNPLVMYGKDEFWSTGTGSGAVGDLGWGLANGSVSNVSAESGHGGVIQLNSGGGPVLQSLNLNAILSEDTAYAAAILNPLTTSGVKVGFGLATNLGGVGSSVGAYWGYDPGISSNWQSYTFDGGVAETLDSGVVVLDDTWYLLEIVIDVTNTESNISFYLNRSASTRHTTALFNGFTWKPAFFNESTFFGSAITLVDTFVLAGKLPPSAKRWD